jgi:hypothetical protein
MAVILNSKFATPEDVAKALGVSKTRLKWLLRLTDRKRISETERRRRNAKQMRRRRRL